jgi:hypothetical protein
MYSNLSSATPRAFLYPIFAGFLYCISHNRDRLGLIFTALQTVCYPPLVLVHLCLLGLRCWDGSARPLPLTRSKEPYGWAIASLVVALLLLFPILSHRSDVFGELVTREQMASMAEFGPNGRTPFFVNNPLAFWFSGTSGLNPPHYPYAIWVAYAFPFLHRRRAKSGLAADSSKTPTINTALLTQMGVAALILFLAAHLLLFRLYWPSRYPYYTLPFLFSISAGVVLTRWIAKVQKWLRDSWLRQRRQKGLAVVSICFMVITLALPLNPSLVLNLQGWVQGSEPELYRFLAQQPKDTLIAGLGHEVSNIPAFTLRSVLFSQETAIPFHTLVD